MTCTKHCVDVEQFHVGTQTYTFCPLCYDEKKKAVEAQEAVNAEDALRERLESGRVEVEHRTSTLHNFEQITDIQKKCVLYAKALADKKIEKLILVGGYGTGKTHIACALVRELGGELWTMYEIVTRIRSSYTLRAKETEAQIVGELASLAFLAIDELGRTKGSEAELNWLSYIIDKRHVRKLPTLLCSNKHMKSDCKKGGCSDCFENFMGEDVMSRLRQAGRLVKMTGEDYRGRK